MFGLLVRSDIKLMYHRHRRSACYRLLDYLVQIWDTEQTVEGLDFRSGPSTARATVKVKVNRSLLGLIM